MITMGPPLPTSQSGPPAPLHTVLSQLSFATDIPPDELQLRNTGSVWSGLFCTSFDEDDTDLFFDAQETLIGDGSMDSLVPIRGGHADETSGELSQAETGNIIDHDMQGPAMKEYPAHASLEQRDRLENRQKDIQKRTLWNDQNDPFAPLPGPRPPDDLPIRFLRAGKGDPEEGWLRYEATLKWRQEYGIDNILTDSHPNFDLIKKNYPHYYHLRGRQGEPVFFEQPPKTNLQAMKDGGVVLDGLLRHYAMVTEFQWQFVERDDFARSITVLDLEGMRMRDFVGECIEYVRRCSEFTGQHFPERAGYVFVINVPGWFAMIWNVVKPMVDEVTLKKINILRGKKEIFEALLEKIPIENIPPEYGGESVHLGESPEEELLHDLMHHNNALAEGDYGCGGRAADPPCRFCSFVPARSY